MKSILKRPETVTFDGKDEMCRLEWVSIRRLILAITSHRNFKASVTGTKQVTLKGISNFIHNYFWLNIFKDRMFGVHWTRDGTKFVFSALIPIGDDFYVPASFAGKIIDALDMGIVSVKGRSDPDGTNMKVIGIGIHGEEADISDLARR